MAKFGALPTTCAIIGLGVWVAAASYALARAGVEAAPLVFWAGVLLICLPSIVRLWSDDATRRERVGSLLTLGGGLYLLSVLRSPRYLTGFDELLHWRTADDILRTGHLFTANPLLPVSPLHPGLEIVTSALVSLGGLSIHEAAILVVGTARVVFVLAMYLIYERASGSSRAAGLGTLVYMGSSTFVFFDTQFAYESLGVPLCLVAIYFLERRGIARGPEQLAWAGLGALVILAVPTVHHVSGYLLVAFLWLWASASWYLNAIRRAALDRARLVWAQSQLELMSAKRRVTGVERLAEKQLRTTFWSLMARYSDYLDQKLGRTPAGNREPEPGRGEKIGAAQPTVIWVAILAAAASLLWLAVVASVTLSYLAPYARDAVAVAMSPFAGRAGGREMSVSGSSGINYERLVAMASVLVIMGFLALGFRHWRRVRSSALGVVLLGCALAYPAIPALRLNESTWEVSNRAAGFLFVAVGLIAGLGLSGLPGGPRGSTRARRALARIVSISGIVGLVVIICGGIIGGSNPVTRLPGPYAVAADERSIDDQGLASADWAYRLLGSDNRMAGDRVQTVLMGSYGHQRMIVNLADGVSVSGVFLSEALGETEMKVIREARIRYLVIDRRIATGLPLYGYYFESWEKLVVPFVPPVDLAALDKFDRIPGVSRVYDSGDIRVYDLGQLAREP